MKKARKVYEAFDVLKGPDKESIEKFFGPKKEIIEKCYELILSYPERFSIISELELNDYNYGFEFMLNRNQVIFNLEITNRAKIELDEINGEFHTEIDNVSDFMFMFKLYDPISEKFNVLKGPSEETTKKYYDKRFKELEELMENGKWYDLELELNTFPVPEVSTNISLGMTTFEKVVKNIDEHLKNLFIHETERFDYYEDYDYTFRNEEGEIIDLRNDEGDYEDKVVFPYDLGQGEAFIVEYNKNDINYQNSVYMNVDTILMYKYGMYDPLNAWHTWIDDNFEVELVTATEEGRNNLKMFITTSEKWRYDV